MHGRVTSPIVMPAAVFSFSGDTGGCRQGTNAGQGALMCNLPARADADCWNAASHSLACAVSVTEIFILGGTAFMAGQGPGVKYREVVPAGQSVIGRQLTHARQSSRKDNCPLTHSIRVEHCTSSSTPAGQLLGTATSGARCMALMRKRQTKALGNESSPPVRPGMADCSAN